MESNVISSGRRELEQKTSSYSFTVSTNMLISLIGVVCFVGFVLMALYIGNGLITLPYSLVYQWWQRPKKLTSAEMGIERTKMQRKLRKMIDTAKDLKCWLLSPSRKRKYCNRSQRMVLQTLGKHWTQ